MNGKVVERMIHLNGGMLGIDRETKGKKREQDCARASFSS